MTSGKPRPGRRTPTAVLEARGAFQEHPSRRKEREGEPVVTAPLGDPPGHMGKAERECWLEIERTAPPGVLTGADRFLVEMLATLMVEFRAKRVAMPAAQLAKMMDAMGRIGMTPSDRSVIKVAPQKKPPSRLDQLMKSIRGQAS